jgi:hypothetical protein
MGYTAPVLFQVMQDVLLSTKIGFRELQASFPVDSEDCFLRAKAAKV